MALCSFALFTQKPRLAIGTTLGEEGEKAMNLADNKGDRAVRDRRISLPRVAITPMSTPSSRRWSAKAGPMSARPYPAASPARRFRNGCRNRRT